MTCLCAVIPSEYFAKALTDVMPSGYIRMPDSGKIDG
jgi:hypothetical protein